MIMISGLLALAMIWGASAWRELGQLARDLFVSSADLDVSLNNSGWMSGLVSSFISLVAPVLLVGVVLAVLANLVQTGPIFSFHPLKPKGERINPVAGFKRVFNKKMLFEAFKSLLKLLVLGGVAVAFFFALWPQLLAPQSSDGALVQEWFGHNAVALLFRLGMALVLIGLLDLMYTRKQVQERHDDEPARGQGRGQAPRGRPADPRQAARAAARKPQAGGLGEARARGRRADHEPGAPGHRAALRARQHGGARAAGAAARIPGPRRCARWRAATAFPSTRAARWRGSCSASARWARPFPPIATSTWRASTPTWMRNAAASPSTRCAR